MTPGGAGIGDPRERTEANIRDDVESDLVSKEKAATVYGFSR
jgi:N-methylhydantoinase B